MKKYSFGKTAVVAVVCLLVSLMSFLVSCPNNTIGGSVEKDGRSNAEILITGMIGKPLTDSRKFTVTLNNATFRNFSRGEDVSAWFVDKEGNPSTIGGLKYRIANPVASGSNKASIRITGTPTVASKEQIHLLIPCDTFQGPVKIDVDTEGAIRYNIIDYIEPTLTLIKVDGNNMTIDGMEQKEIDTKTIKFQLNNAHFTSADALNGNIDNSASGDGTIINTQGGGQQFDQNTAKWLNFKWEIGTGKNENGELNELDLIVTGTADKVRGLDSGDTFKVKLIKGLLYDGSTADKDGNPIISIIDDNNGEPYVKDIPIDGTGVYNFVELAPTFTMVKLKDGSYNDRLNSYEKLQERNIEGTTDKTAGLGFSSANVYYLLNDATASKTESGSAVVIDTEKLNSVFGEGFAESGLTASINIYQSTLKDDNGNDLASSPVLFEVDIIRGDNIKPSEATYTFTLTDELIKAFSIKKTGDTEVYSKSIVSTQKIKVNITEPKPNVANSNEYITFSAVATEAVPDEVTLVEEYRSLKKINVINGGTLTLYNKDSFRFKSTTDVGTSHKLSTRTENTITDGKVTIEPTRPYMDYYYELVAPETESDNIVAIKLYVKQNQEALDDDQEPVTPDSKDVTYTEGSYKDYPNGFKGSFYKDKNGNDYNITVTLDSSLFEKFEQAETQVQTDEATGKWVDYTGSDVVITNSGPNTVYKVRYRIMGKDTLSLVSPWAKVSSTNEYIQNIVRYNDDSGNIYDVSYDNQGIANNGGKDITFSSGTTWVAIPNALPTSPIGALNNVSTISKPEVLTNSFNTSVYPNFRDYTSTSGRAYEDALYKRFDLGDSSTARKAHHNTSFNRFQIVGALPEGYTIDPDDFTENDIRIFNAVKYTTGTSKYAVYPIMYNDEEINTINKNVKFKVAFDEAGITAKIPTLKSDDRDTWYRDMSGATPFYVYLDTLTDEGSELTKLIEGYYETSFDGSTTGEKIYPNAPVLTYPDIRINPSKLINIKTRKAHLKKSKAEKTTDGSVYNGDVSKLQNGDAWLVLAESVEGEKCKKDPDDKEISSYMPVHLKLYVLPNEVTVNNETVKALSWQYRIMDRADYTYLSAYPFGAPYGTSISDWYNYNLRHNLKSLSVNADMTTGVTKNIGMALTKESDGSLPSYGAIQLQTSNYASDKVYESVVLPLNLKEYTRKGVDTNNSRVTLTDNSDDAKKKDRDLPYDDRSIPIRELKSGTITQDVYNKDTVPTIEATVLQNIVNSAKRKGYRVKGFARGRNHMTAVFPDAMYSTTKLPSGSTNVWSDLVPYKGVDDFGNPVDWQIYWHDSTIDMDKSTVLSKGITLNLSDARAYRHYVYPSGSNGYNVYSFTDWYNTTYIYLLWEPDPYSEYYNATDNGAVGSFVTIPGDLNWPGYRTPYYIDGNSIKNVDFSSKPYNSDSGLGSNDRVYKDVSKEFYSVKPVADNDFSISTTEMNADLFKTVYDWATTSGGYSFSGSSETYSPFAKNYYEKYWSQDPTAVKKESSSFSISNIYGGKREVAATVEADITYSSIDGDGSQPVTNVNLFDAMLFCNALTDYSNDNLGTSFTKAYGDYKNYSDIKSNWNDLVKTASSKDGYRLPTYNEWFAAASIVPDTDDFLLTATTIKNDEPDFFNTTRNNVPLYNFYRGSFVRSGLVSYTPSGRLGSEFSSYSSNDKNMYYDTTYPFMQSLNIFSGGNLSGLSGGDLYSSYIGNISQAQSYSWSSAENANKNAILSSTRAVGAGSPNSLGMYNMSGNVAEWTVLPSGGMVVAGGDWTGVIGDAFLLNDNDGTDSNSGVGTLPSGVSNILPTSSELKSHVGQSKSAIEGRVYDPDNYYYSSFSSSDTRNSIPYNQRSYNVGFRVCRSIIQ